MTGAQSVCLVHYHELALKGHNRSAFERRLRDNVAAAVRRQFPDAAVSRISGRILVTLDSYASACQTAALLCLIPGVARVSCALRCERDLEAIGQTALECLAMEGGFESFKVVSRRANTDFPTPSPEMNVWIGSWLSERLIGKAVRMKGADREVHVEVIEAFAYVYTRSIPGVGGLPAGSSGKVLSLLSAGLDSPVATWRMMRRGAAVTALHFSGAPETPDSSSHIVAQIAGVLAVTGGLEGVRVVDFGTYQRAIAHEVPESLRVVFYRRLMVAMAMRLARRIGAKALVTGESLGQVASQTIENISVVDAIADCPVFRPLIGTDKIEIINEAKRLGTYELSVQSHDDCCTLFMPRRPETKAKPHVVDPLWAALPVAEWVDEALANLRTLDF
jgi:thiamine biosynthesis protein ThiI